MSKELLLKFFKAIEKQDRWRPLSEYHKRRIGEGLTDLKLSDKTKRLIAESRKRMKFKKLKCPYCGTKIASNQIINHIRRNKECLKKQKSTAHRPNKN